MASLRPLLFRWRSLDKQGGLTAIETGQSSVPAKQYAEAIDEIKRLQRLLGQMASDNALLREAVEIMTGKKMDCALSLIRAGKSVSHVCRVLRLARSNVCRLLHRAADWQDGRHCRQQRRDLISDQDLLERIKAVLGKFPCFGYKRIRVLPNCGMPSIGIRHVLCKLMYRIVESSKPEPGGCSAIENAQPE